MSLRSWDSHNILWGGDYCYHLWYHFIYHLIPWEHGSVEIWSSDSRVLALDKYSTVLSCLVRPAFPSITHLKRKHLLEKNVEVWTQSWGSHRRSWCSSLCLFMEEFTLSFQDSIYHLEAEKDVGKKRLRHPICLMWVPFVRLGIQFR